MIFYSMDHRGGLDEALKTRTKIDEDEFNSLLINYEYYCFDERINCIRFILRDMEHSNLPVWLLIEI